MNGQMDTESDADPADIHMEEVAHWPAIPTGASASNGQESPVNLVERIAEQLRQPPVLPASAAPVAQWPSMDDASVAEGRRRTARRQQRRAEEFATNERRSIRPSRGNASTRAVSRTSNFPPILTFDSRAPPTG